MYYGSGTVAHTVSQWRHTPSVGYVAAGGQELSCRISSRSDLKRRSLGLFWRASPHEEEKHKNQSISHLFIHSVSQSVNQSINQSINQSYFNVWSKQQTATSRATAGRNS